MIGRIYLKKLGINNNDKKIFVHVFEVMSSLNVKQIISKLLKSGKEAAYDERFHLRVWSEQIGPKIVQKVAVEAG